jgi:uncharacterized protein YhaN
MKEKDCANCDYQRSIDSQHRVKCLVDGLWHERGYRCEDFKDYEQSKNVLEKLSQAFEKKWERETKANGESEREFAEKMAQRDRDHATELQRERMAFDKKLWMASWWWQLGLILFGALVGFGLGRLFK